MEISRQALEKIQSSHYLSERENLGGWGVEKCLIEHKKVFAAEGGREDVIQRGKCTSGR